jgi:hypothetical protein
LKVNVNDPVKLDDPSDFSIWAEIEPNGAGEFRRWMAAQRGLPELTIHQMFGPPKAGLPTQLHANIGWRRVAPLLACLPSFVKAGTEKVSEGPWRPTAQTPFCSKHNLYYRSKACPICSGSNYI